MKHKGMKRLVTLVLAVSLVFTMSVPAFAGTAEEAKNPGGVKYLAIGDSIAAGVKNPMLDSFYRDGAWWNGQENINKIGNKAAKHHFQQFYDFYSYTDDVKNDDVYAVDFSFVSKVADAIKADEKKSYNGAYPGLRSKDICQLLGIPEADEDNYETDYDWASLSNFSQLYKNNQNAANYKNAIANADVITIELGANDLSAYGNDLNDQANRILMIQNILETAQKLSKAISGEKELDQWTQLQLRWLGIDNIIEKKNPEDIPEIISQMFGLDPEEIKEYLSPEYQILDTREYPLMSDLAAKILANGISFEGISLIDTEDINIEEVKEHFGDLSNAKSLGEVINTLKAIEEDLTALEKVGADITSLLKEFFSVAGGLIDNGKYYLESLMKYIQENKKPGAIVVVGTFINPIGTPDDEDNKVRKALDLLYYDIMNSFIKTNAGIYDYYVADLSDVNMNPDPDEYPVGEGDKPLTQEYNMHPNGEGQEIIAQSFLEQIQKAQREEKVAKVIKTAETVATVAALLVAPAVSDIKEKISDKITSNSKKKTTITETTKEETVVEQEPVVTETVEDLAITAEEVTEMISDATLRCTTEKTEKGIKVTAKVEDVDLNALAEEGYQVAYKFYRSTKKASGYTCIFTSKTGKFTNTSVEEGNKYYYKTVLVVTDSEGNEVTKSVLKDCKYGSRTF